MDKVIIEILHIKGCPDCTEVIKMVREITDDLKDFSDKIDLRILDIFENNQRVIELGMYKCPAIAINGNLQYVGSVPLRNELRNFILYELSKISD